VNEKDIGIDYSVLHQIDSPANRLIREAIWGKDKDIGAAVIYNTLVS